MPRDLDYAADILAAARLAVSYVQGVSHAAFVVDTMRQDAVVRELLIIGEAAKRLSTGSRVVTQAFPGGRWPA